MTIRVYKMPSKLTNGFCFGGPVPITFGNVDWFDSETPFGRPTAEQVEAEVKRKKYYDPQASFLVLGDDPDHVFVIRSAIAP